MKQTKPNHHRHTTKKPPIIGGFFPYALPRLMAFLLCLGLLLGFAGCGGGSRELRLDIPGRVTSLDPQFATDPTSQFLLRNLMEGLLVQREDGTLDPGVAESYQISADGLTYTFTLRQNARWEDGDPVTAQDFVYAFGRMMNPQVTSPYAGDFLAIRGAREVLAGEMPMGRLGVEARGDTQLVISLEEPAPLLLQQLASPGALPCRQDFFEGTRARYGLDKSYFLSNGPYRLSRWDNDKSIVLAASQQYWDRENVPAPSVTCYIGREDPKGRFLKGDADLYQLSYEDIQGLDRSKFSYRTRNNTVWTLTFCQSRRALDEVRVRRALVGAIDPAQAALRLPPQYTPTQSPVPESAVLFQQPYRAQAGAVMPIGSLGDAARGPLREWLLEQDMTTLSGLSLILPQSANLAALGGYLQRVWQDHLLLYINLEVLPDDQYQRRLAAGNFDMALTALPAASDSPQGTLDSYRSTSPGNLAGYHNPQYDYLLQQALSATRPREAAALYRQGEQLLLDEAVVLPLFSQPTYFALGKGVQGVELLPDGSCYLKYAQRA